MGEDVREKGKAMGAILQVSWLRPSAHNLGLAQLHQDPHFGQRPVFDIEYFKHNTLGTFDERNDVSLEGSPEVTRHLASEKNP